MAESGAAFEALTQLAERSRAAARGLPAQVDIRPHWSGIGFALMGSYFVAPLGEVSEMLEVPAFTHLPGVQPWVQGVANVRGRLLPIFDMAMFYGQRLTGTRKQRRVLILETETLYTGLLVDQVFGMQHFPVDEYQEEAGPVEDSIRSYTAGSYQVDGQRWTVFRPALLAEDPRFINAAKT
ncbi:chemotaxis protein CheW [Marinimicrobium sp. ABcell2]|uniref:chemotaxis protein CheW n=1 Tax=Marinimicrobium sp. ABcell2 TaxID=3069751 RepID=UPI0027B37340|nr:chemotaxis protein CheW [Marinimicrobium sp. ABcell2]MDQ2076575.1 chemotaxis protein CheW [Marinimicrobium sp. ABcell2]